MPGYLREDIAKVKQLDPAATSSVAVLLCYPGIHATAAHRSEHWLWQHGRRGLARFMSQCTRFFTGIEIHPGAQLGRRVVIDHGMGVIIGETSVVGDDVLVYQGVTLGGTGKEGGKRHPNIGDAVIIGVGASVLGNITIGERTKVGAGAVVVDNVPPDCTVVGVPGRVVKQEGIRICPADPDRRDLLPDPVEAQITALEERVLQLEQELAQRLERERAEYQRAELERLQEEQERAELERLEEEQERAEQELQQAERERAEHERAEEERAGQEQADVLEQELAALEQAALLEQQAQEQQAAEQRADMQARVNQALDSINRLGSELSVLSSDGGGIGQVYAFPLVTDQILDTPVPARQHYGLADNAATVPDATPGAKADDQAL